MQELPRESQPDLITLEGEMVGSLPIGQASCLMGWFELACWPLLLSCEEGDLWLEISCSAPTGPVCKVWQCHWRP